jgi:hypothetical protein
MTLSPFIFFAVKNKGISAIAIVSTPFILSSLNVRDMKLIKSENRVHSHFWENVEKNLAFTISNNIYRPAPFYFKKDLIFFI